MDTTLAPLLSLTAGDLMTRVVVVLEENTSLQRCAYPAPKSSGAAPVVDDQGRCVGMLSTVDFVRFAEKRFDITRVADPAMPITCPFWVKETVATGRHIARCTLPPGVCPLQVTRPRNGESVTVCGEPHCVFTDWQLVELEKLPADEVSNFMTADPVTVPPETPIGEMAKRMIDAHIHRLVVIDSERQPIGIVSTTDLLAALARQD